MGAEQPVGVFVSDVLQVGHELREAFEHTLCGEAGSFSRDVAGRFLIPVQPEQTGATPLTVVTNWPALLK